MSDLTLTLPEPIQAAIDATASVKLHSAHTDEDILEQVYRLRHLADDAEAEDVEDRVEEAVATLLDRLDERRAHKRALSSAKCNAIAAALKRQTVLPYKDGSLHLSVRVRYQKAEVEPGGENWCDLPDGDTYGRMLLEVQGPAGEVIDVCYGMEGEPGVRPAGNHAPIWWADHE